MKKYLKNKLVLTLAFCVSVCSISGCSSPENPTVPDTSGTEASVPEPVTETSETTTSAETTTTPETTKSTTTTTKKSDSGDSNRGPFYVEPVNMEEFTFAPIVIETPKYEFTVSTYDFDPTDIIDTIEINFDRPKFDFLDYSDTNNTDGNDNETSEADNKVYDNSLSSEKFQYHDVYINLPAAFEAFDIPGEDTAYFWAPDTRKDFIGFQSLATGYSAKVMADAVEVKIKEGSFDSYRSFNYDRYEVNGNDCIYVKYLTDEGSSAIGLEQLTIFFDNEVVYVTAGNASGYYEEAIEASLNSVSAEEKVKDTEAVSLSEFEYHGVKLKVPDTFVKTEDPEGALQFISPEKTDIFTASYLNEGVDIASYTKDDFDSIWKEDSAETGYKGILEYKPFKFNGNDAVYIKSDYNYEGIISFSQYNIILSTGSELVAGTFMGLSGKYDDAMLGWFNEITSN